MIKVVDNDYGCVFELPGCSFKAECKRMGLSY
jgi:hypothetical protein